MKNSDFEIKDLQLSEHLKTRLSSLNITRLFPVQAELMQVFRPLQRDILCCAQTGSGKTLAFAIPIVQVLLNRRITRLRALIVLPTRDLANQVKTCFESLTFGSNLVVGFAVGSSSFTNEQSGLVDEKSPLQWASKVDILIATPGRLLDHLSSTKGFSLKHVEFLVMDEADRLMNQHYQGWLDTVYDAIESNDGIQIPFSMGNTKPVLKLRRHVQKLLFSATLTTNPGKLAALKLNDPIYITITGEQNTIGGITLPPTLKEEYLVVEQSDKPLALITLLKTRSLKSVLVFVKSVQAASRLDLLLQQTNLDLKTSSLSSEESLITRKQILEKFNSGLISTLICSDLMARGMDSGVETIINYDIPTNLVTYVHRVGRCARAGRHGTSITICEPGQEYWFKRDIVNQDNVKRSVGVEKLDNPDWNGFLGAYQKGLLGLKRKVKGVKGSVPDSSSTSSNSSSSSSSSSSDSSSSSGSSSSSSSSSSSDSSTSSYSSSDSSSSSSNESSSDSDSEDNNSRMDVDQPIVPIFASNWNEHGWIVKDLNQSAF